MVDRSKYIGRTFIRFDDLADAPQQKLIVDVEDGQYDKLVATFDDDTCLSLNKTNLRTLSQAYGKDDENWIGQRIELFQGTVPTKEGERDAILIRLLGTPALAKSKTKPRPSRDDDLDHQIPFH